MPSALITGVSGQDGSYLAEQLHGLGWNVHALVRAEISQQEQVVPSWVTQHIGDLEDAASLRDAVDASDADHIFNLAGITSVALSWEKPEMTARVTGLAVATLLDAAKAAQERRGTPVRFLQATSAEIFGAATEFPQTETTPVRPVSPYGAAKAYAQHLVGVYRGTGLFAASAILYNHESPRRPTSFVTRKITAGVARIAAGLEDGIVLGNLDAERDWGWAPDYVDAMVRIATAETADDYVIASGQTHSVRDFVAAAFHAVGIDDWQPYVSVDERFNRPVDAPRMGGDHSKATAALGWTPTLGFDDIVAAMVEHDLALIAG